MIDFGVCHQEALSVHVGERADSTLLGTWQPLVQRSASAPLQRFLFGCFLAQSFLALLLAGVAYDKTPIPLRKGIDNVLFLSCFFCFCFRRVGCSYWRRLCIPGRPLFRSSSVRVCVRLCRRGVCWGMFGLHNVSPQRDFNAQFQLQEGWERHSLPQRWVNVATGVCSCRPGRVRHSGVVVICNFLVVNAPLPAGDCLLPLALRNSPHTQVQYPTGLISFLKGVASAIFSILL